MHFYYVVGEKVGDDGDGVLGIEKRRKQVNLLALYIML